LGIHRFLTILFIALEPQAMNYLSFHVEKYNISQEQLDNARLSGAKNSPMMEGIEHCIHQIDEQVMEELTPRILHIVRKGTGLPTKVIFFFIFCMSSNLTIYRLDVLVSL
jgi:proteasome component ECM29